MNFMPATVEGDLVKLPMVDAPLDAVDARGAGGRSEPDRGHPAGALRGRGARSATTRSRSGGPSGRKIDLVESMGSELYAHFSVQHEGVESEELAELAQDSGAADVPGGGGDTVVARLDPESA